MFIYFPPRRFNALLPWIRKLRADLRSKVDDGDDFICLI